MHSSYWDGPDSADGGNTSISQNCGIIPQGIRTTILRFSEERFGLAFLIVNPRPELLSEQPLDLAGCRRLAM